MEEKSQKCTKCGKEYPLTKEYYRRDKKQLDGFRSECRKCSAMMRTGTSSRKVRRKNADASGNGGRTRKTKYIKSKFSVTVKKPVTMASPEEIIGALRKGVALEICQMIQERFR